MGTHRKTLEKICPKCGKNLVEVSMKNPYIDDCDEGCDNDECSAYSDMEGRMYSSARSNARAEEAADEDLCDDFANDDQQENEDEEEQCPPRE